MDKDKKALKSIISTSDTVESILTSLERRGEPAMSETEAPILRANNLKDAALKRAEKLCNANHEAQKKAKEESPDNMDLKVNPGWTDSEKIRKNNYFKKAEQLILEESAIDPKTKKTLYKKAEAHETPFTFEGDLPIFMKIMVRHSKDGINKKDASALVSWNSFVQDIRNDCAESLKKVSKQKRWYKTGTFSTLFIDDEAFIVCYAHNLVKQTKKQFQIKGADGKPTGEWEKNKEWVEDFTFPKPVTPKPKPAPKPYKGLPGFNQEAEKVKETLAAFLDLKPYELASK